MRKIIIFICILSLFLVVIYPKNVYAMSSLDDILTKADDFLRIDGGTQSTGNNTLGVLADPDLKNTSDFLYNTLLGISMIAAVIVGMVLGIKYMLATSEEKADLKQTLPAYIVSCIVVFGAFSIWKLLINIIQ